jgi:selenobiotic family peptide radical SAM maturase
MLRDGRLFGRKASSFTLQWHLTHACELHCQHCYDRSSRSALSLVEARRIFDDFRGFCRARDVRGQVCLTGGNPFLYPHFLDLYATIAESGYPISILGNPVDEAVLAEVVSLRRPVYFQVSLEGLPAYNDHIRGPGHFERVEKFLAVLRRQEVTSQVMLTLHRDNLDQLIPLGERLRGQVDRFFFNRLSQVGGGESLALPSREEYVDVLKRYIVAARSNPHFHFKDGLFSILRYHFHRPLARGCTGFGCGAAFNFVAVLPDGEVHACRKFPSPLGNLTQSSLASIYASPLARRYRRGSAACRFCRLRNVCGGCLAVVHGAGKSALIARDPHCFMAQRREFLRNF